MDDRPPVPPRLVLAIGVAGISFSAILVRSVEGVHPLVIAFWRLALATLMLAPFALLLERRAFRSLRPSDVGTSLVVGVALAVHFGSWITSLFETTVAASVVLVATYALLVPVAAHFLLRERVERRVGTAVLVAFAGVALIGLADLGAARAGGDPLLGDLLALLGAFAAAGYILAGRRLRQRIGLFTYVTLVYGACSLVLGTVVAALHLSSNVALWGFPTRTWLLLLAMAFFPTVLGHTLLNWCLRWLPAPTVSTSILVEPVVSTLLAIRFLSEVPSPLVFAGGALTLVGIWLAVVRRGAVTAPRAA